MPKINKLSLYDFIGNLLFDIGFLFTINLSVIGLISITNLLFTKPEYSIV